MATIKTKSKYIERNNYDYVRAYAETQSSNPTIVDELIQAYVLIAQNLNISPLEFIQRVESQGNNLQQALYLASQLNTVRPRNSYLGVSGSQNIPLYVAREISA